MGVNQKETPVPQEAIKADTVRRNTKSRIPGFEFFRQLRGQIDKFGDDDRDNKLFAKLYRYKIPGRQLLVHELDEDITQMSQESWREMLEPAGYKGQELEYASKFMTAFSQGMADTRDYHMHTSEQPLKEFELPRFAFSWGTKIFAKSTRGTVILS